MVRNLKRPLLTGLFMLLGGGTLLCGEYRLNEFRSVVGAGGMVWQSSSKGTYSVSAVLGQQSVIEDKANSNFMVKQGFWIESEGTSSVDDGQIEQNAQFSNYPNPFNTSTKISYELPGSAYVTIKVYDLVGNVVKTIYDGYQNSGMQELAWDGFDNTNNSLPSGSYICELSARPMEMSGSEAFNAYVSRNVMVIVR